MKNIISFTLLICLILGSCNKENISTSICNVENPLEELSWLVVLKNSLTNCTCEVSIFQGNYKNQTVFYTQITDPLCNSVFNVELKNCEGKIIKEYHSNEHDIFSTEVSKVKIIYRCEN